MNFITNAIAATMGCISAIGTACAGPIPGWGSSRRLVVLGLATVALGAASPMPATSLAELTVSVAGLRDHKGNLLFCLTRRTAQFLECDKDPGAVHGSVAASVGTLDFQHVAPGEWALLMIHDSNMNGKLDKRFGIPREGFGFSRNPAIKFGAPSADDVRFEIPAGESHQQIKMRYIF
jgi:uncharacterized protein (DUF2141 family)